MRRLLLAVPLLFLAAAPARAQVASALAVSACGNQTYTAGPGWPLTVDLTGKLCGNTASSIVPSATNGWTTKLLNGLTNTAVAIKASGGQLSKIYCYNPNATVAYIQVYNVAAAGVTVGTTAPAHSYGIPPVSSGGFAQTIGDQYSTAISAAVTTTATGGTAPGTAMDCNASYN